ncbi:unnamed protein product [Ixodes pacificus]
MSTFEEIFGYVCENFYKPLVVAVRGKFAYKKATKTYIVHPALFML